MHRKQLFHAIVFTLVLGAVAQTAWAVTSLSSCTTITQPGSYQLTQDLKVNGGCFIILASNVTLDLQHHTIEGNGTGEGIRDSGRQIGIRIKNGSIKNFATGVSLTLTHGAVLDYVFVLSNGSTGMLTGPGARITGALVHGYGLSGIQAGAGSYVVF